MCKCGNTINVTDTHLKSGHTTSCGCFHKKIMQDFLIKDISGQKFGKLTVLEKAYIKNGRQYWHCKCDCGKTCIAYTTSLLSGKRKSCGCLISKAEYELSLYLDKNNIPYESQYKFDDCKDIRCLPFDFVIFDKNKNITMAIELNGAQHYHLFTYSNEDKVTQILNLKDRQKKDKIKRDYCLKNNIPLLVVKYTNFNKKEELFDNFYKNIVGEKYA